MIDLLKIEGFKCFSAIELAFGKLTLFTGFNGAGKSTACQPLLLLSQGLRRTPNLRVMPLNGDLVSLGTAGDVVSASEARPLVRFGLGLERRLVEWTFGFQTGQPFMYRESIGGDEHSPSENELGFIRETKIRELSFLGPTRPQIGGPYPVRESAYISPGEVGADGRFAPYCLHLFADEIVPIERRHPLEQGSTIRKQVDAWMAELFPSAQVNVQFFPQLRALGLEFRTSDTGEWRHPTNIGFGYSYALPIVVALLTAREGDIFVVDSPESHLHPSAQSAMGRLLARIASAGVQVICETHSDHLLNGVRLALREGLIRSEEFTVYFFSGAAKHEHGVVNPKFDQLGRVDEWPDGFFDQSERDLVLLAGWG